MTIHAGHITRLKTLWVDRFTDTVSITAPAVRTYNRATNDYTEVAGASRYSGVGKVRITERTADVQSGESERTLRHFELILPATVENVAIDDQVSVTAALDPALVGVTGRVFEVREGGWNTTRRVMFEEAQQ